MMKLIDLPNSHVFLSMTNEELASSEQRKDYNINAGLALCSKDSSFVRERLSAAVLLAMGNNLKNQ